MRRFARDWVSELLQLAALTVLGFVGGWPLGQPGFGAFLGVLVHVGLLYSRLFRIHAWLKADRTRRVPFMPSVLGTITEEIYRLRQRDRKRKQRLATMLRHYQQFTRAMPDATVVLGANEEVVWLNRAAQALLGLKSRDVGYAVTNFVRHPSFVRFIRAHDFERTLEIPSPASDGKVLSIRRLPYGDDQSLLIARDITRIHRLKAVRQDFVANVSHELRTPLTVVAGYVETLNDGADELPPEVRPIMEQIERQTARMRRIVEDLLLLSRLETTAIDESNMEPVDVAGMADAIADDARMLSGEEDHRITVEADRELRIPGVPGELRSALSNLVFNAVKYTPAGGDIRVRWYRRGREEACFEVVDSGIGIEPKHIHRLTERFYRVDVGRSRAVGGTGLGLAIVKHVLQRHQARLEIESEPGEGSTFRCVFLVNGD